ncbi:thiamine biosynthesis lipoprotein [Modicisalibacter ilicicola DSM 19980]|uniref:FAD:protein FMN transferase n=1 Tax=Modicisalibacter ilicicola DSM 19980 TaxID=1121942 RepID=A0A1M5BRL9_9GAMM|nr:FAD:protein FMN transferase [Halomonas ilicicola]SHF45050.1 thiamine biosynthesis lipoprotein [Halomonas ilicicola DSM 19980]
MMHAGCRKQTGPASRGLALLLMVLASALLTGCDTAPAEHRFQGPIFGTGYHVTVYAELAEDDYARLESGILAELERIDSLMSTYRDDSELSRFNRLPVGVPFFVSPATAEVLRESMRIARLTEGAFDVTVGPVVNLWGFGPEGRPEQVPDEATLREALARVDAEALHLEDGRLSKTKPVYVDLSGIAKGYATDRVADYLESRGIEDYLVEVGGEIRTHGTKPGGAAWRIAVEKPVSSERSVQRIIDLGDAAVATSGDYRNYFESDGVRYSHTIDPRSGRPIDNRVASVTVITERCATADALATAFTVMGAEAGLDLAEAQNIAVYFVVRQDDGFETRISSSFEVYLDEFAEEETI